MTNFIRTRRFSTAVGVLAGVLVTIVLVPAPAAGQAAAPAWTPPRTAWGDVDLQGTWTNFTIANTQIEAPGGPEPRLLGGTGTCIPAGTRPVREGNLGGGNNPLMEGDKRSLGNRALVVEPANGKLPPLTPWGEARINEICTKIFDSYEYIDPWVRCISRGVPASMFPSAYNNAYQIIQIPGFVVIHYEMIHDVRIIPLDDRPRLPPTVRQWLGDARGRWEGNTLVVETTNFHDKGAIRGRAHSEMLRVTERFTRVDADNLAYETTVDDPKTWTAPWKVAIPLNRDDDYQMYEYACHEGNLSVGMTLGGARAAEKAAATK
jgi:hypothetical protein